MSQTARLTNRAILSLSGPEARDFLQGLITNDVRAAKPGQPAYAALLTPQGKILFDFMIHADGDTLLLDIAADRREALRKRLTMYRLRAKVEIAARDELCVVARWGADVMGNDPRHARLGARTVENADVAAGSDDYEAHRLGLGIPESSDFGVDRMFALDADLDELHGVAFDKGCYVGQELTARMKHRGTARKRLLPIEALDGAALAPVDTAVVAGGRDIGEITAVYGARGFVLTRLDRLEDAGDAAVEAGGNAVRILKPDWL
ncbi:MAG TPA: hypothetical protein VL026_09670, partial [Rhizomicrobium sp.]|nr:hypothetical protein [Rhizomicrobium sp.]